MKNTTRQETSFPAPTLRIAFRKEEVAPQKKKRAGRPRQQNEVVESKVDLPLFNDYRIKAKDHDPL